MKFDQFILLILFKHLGQTLYCKQPLEGDRDFLNILLTLHSHVFNHSKGLLTSVPSRDEKKIVTSSNRKSRPTNQEEALIKLNVITLYVTRKTQSQEILQPNNPTQDTCKVI